MTPFVDDPDFTLHVGDALDVLRELAAESVHCVVTSPPYFGLRDYGTEGQLGLEATPELYVARMVEVFREVRRVLRDDGVAWLNIGDSYVSTAPGTRNAPQPKGSRTHPDEWANNRPEIPAGLKPKDLIGVPWRVAFALQADGWYIRSDVIWSKPNAMPESVADRPTKSHEYVFLLAKRARYHYDADAIREPHSPDGRHKTIHDHATDNSHPNYDNVGKGNERWPNGGRNKRSVWEIVTENFPDAHFAVFPQALVEPCIKAGTSERGCCPECGAPWERETERVDQGWDGSKYAQANTPGALKTGGVEKSTLGSGGGKLTGKSATLGWLPGCEHGLDPVPCTVLDPFLGSGTTALVARRLGRRCLGIELNEDYAKLAAKRLQQLSLLA